MLEVQSPKSKVQGLKSKVQGPGSEVCGRRHGPACMRLARRSLINTPLQRDVNETGSDFGLWTLDSFPP